MSLSLRGLRLRGVWLLVVPFMVLARPTVGLLALGAVLAAFGVAVRGWAAGCVRKERELTTAGPYAHTRNPLYLGSLLIGLGVTVAGGRGEFVALFGLFFVWVYGRTIRAEVHHLEQIFGERYAAYAREVPLFFPRALPYRRGDGDVPARRPFTVERWQRNREYEALLGVLAGFAFLTVKMLWR